MTAAVFAAQLCRANGGTGWAATPLEYVASAHTCGKHSVLIITARGNNRDVLKALTCAIEAGASKISVLTMSRTGKIAAMANRWPNVEIHSFELPSGRDGFLATNSLVATMVVLAERSGCDVHGLHKPEQLTLASDVVDRPNLIVLYAGWSTSAAADLESKSTEAALANVMLADYRNFGHGRHHWLAKHSATTAVIALAAELDSRLARQTLELLPPAIPRQLVDVHTNGPLASIELLLKVFLIVDSYGQQRGIDPGRPGVPAFGSKLYHMAAPSGRKSDPMAYCLAKKLRCPVGLVSRHPVYEEAKHGFLGLRREISQTSIKSIVLDYDGTICRPDQREHGIGSEVVEDLVRLIDEGVIIGIATGRGKSVGEDLQTKIPRRCWPQIIVGYYNGSQIRELDSPSCLPVTAPIIEGVISRFTERLRTDTALFASTDIHERPDHVSITFRDSTSLLWARQVILEYVAGWHEGGLKMVESSHSIDVFSVDHSKTMVVSECARRSGIDEAKVIRIGDSGAWPGNDFELLDCRLGLSVDSVSSSLQNCWNILPPGFQGVAGARWYLQRLRLSPKGHRFLLE